MLQVKIHHQILTQAPLTDGGKHHEKTI